FDGKARRTCFGPSITTISRVLTMKRTQIICSTGICATVARYFAPVSRKAKRKEAAQVSAMAKGLESVSGRFCIKLRLSAQPKASEDFLYRESRSTGGR